MRINESIALFPTFSTVGIHSVYALFAMSHKSLGASSSQILQNLHKSRLLACDVTNPLKTHQSKTTATSHTIRKLLEVGLAFPRDKEHLHEHDNSRKSLILVLATPCEGVFERHARGSNVSQLKPKHTSCTVCWCLASTLWPVGVGVVTLSVRSCLCPVTRAILPGTIVLMLSDFSNILRRTGSKPGR